MRGTKQERTSRPRTASIATVAFAVALAVRSFSLYQSPLPFITDGIGYAALARDTIANEGFRVSEMATDQFVFSSLVAIVARVTGIEPLYIIQPLSVLLGALPVLVVVSLTLRLGARWGWPTGRQSVTALVAGLFLALNGAYLQRSYAADEQTLALFFVPVLAVAAVTAAESHDWRWTGLTAVVMAVLPPLHNLSGLVGALVVTGVVFYGVIDADSVRAKPLLGVVIGGILVWLYALGYHPLAEQLVGVRIVQSERLVRAPALFVAWIVLVGIGAAWFPEARRRTQLLVGGGTLGVGFILLVGDTLRPIYPGTASIPSTAMVLLLPLVLPTLVAAAALARVRQGSRPEVTVLALFTGPLVLVGLALTAGVTVDYHQTLHRTHLFLHVPVAVLVGCGVGWYLLLKGRNIRVGVVCLLVVCAAVSAPVAFMGPETRRVAGTTTAAEFSSIEFADRYVKDTWATDGHLARGANYFRGAQSGPVIAWARGDAAEPNCPVLVSSTWTTTGVQAAPSGPIELASERVVEWRSARNVVYSLDGHSTIMQMVQLGPPTGCFN